MSERRLNTLKQPLVPSQQNVPLEGSNETLLHHRIEHKAGWEFGGFNRRKETELKSFDKPVLDIERLTSRPKLVSRGVDIDEEGSMSKRRRDSLTIPHMSEQVSKKEACWSSFLALVVTLLLTIAMAFIGSTTAPKLAVVKPETDLEKLEVFSYLPFYSIVPVFIIFAFCTVLVFMIAKNVVSYVRYGVLVQNDFYSTTYAAWTSGETLKVGSLFLCLVAGEMLFIGAISSFYIQAQVHQAGLCASINTSLLSLLATFFLTVSFFAQGNKVRFMQILGCFLQLVGAACMYLAIGKFQHHQVNHYSALGSTVIVLNFTAVLSIGLMLVILRCINQRSQINFHSGFTVTMIFAVFNAAIICTAFYFL